MSNQINEAVKSITHTISRLSPKDQTAVLHAIESLVVLDITQNHLDESNLAATFAVLQGKFIDENDFWPDGKVPGASINAYLTSDNTHVGGGTTNQNGFYGFAAPCFNQEIRLVATPPPTAGCRKASQQTIFVVDSIIQSHDFKDECSF